MNLMFNIDRDYFFCVVCFILFFFLEGWFCLFVCFVVCLFVNVFIFLLESLLCL